MNEVKAREETDARPDWRKHVLLWSLVVAALALLSVLLAAVFGVLDFPDGRSRIWLAITAIVAVEAAVVLRLGLYRTRGSLTEFIFWTAALVAWATWGVGVHPWFDLMAVLLMMLVVTARPVLLSLDTSPQTPELEAAILQARTGLPGIPRIDLRQKLFSTRIELSERTARRVLAGVAATLAYLLPERSAPISGTNPFPRECARDDLVFAIVHSAGLSRSDAQVVLKDLGNVILRCIKTAADEGKDAVELFPIGLYETITNDGARLVTQPAVLQRGYPGLSASLRRLECGEVPR